MKGSEVIAELKNREIDWFDRHEDMLEVFLDCLVGLNDEEACVLLITGPNFMYVGTVLQDPRFVMKRLFFPKITYSNASKSGIQ